MQGRSKMNVRIASLIAVCAAVMCACGAEKVGVVGLQVNHLAEPQHVGAQPSFGWRMETTRAGARQVAYRVKVTRWARNAANKIVWDSGEVAVRGPPVTLREDLAMRPVSAYVVDGATGASANRHGTARIGSRRPRTAVERRPYLSRTVCGRVASAARSPIRKESWRHGGASRRRACSRSTRTAGRLRTSS